MAQFMSLLNLACGQRLPAEEDGRARRLQLAIAALMMSLLFAMLWGLAAGSRSMHLAAANAYKIPMIVLLSSISAIPAGMLTWKLAGASCRATDLLVGFASGVFSGTLVLAVLSPLVALYYHSSAWAGPLLGQLSVFLALATGSVVFVRGVLKRLENPKRFGTVLLAMGVFFLMQIATVLQLIALASPILPERTVFDRGIDRMTMPSPAATQETR